MDSENFKCHNYYSYQIKNCKYQGPSEWFKDEFSLEDNQVSKTFSLPMRVASEPHVRSFQYKVLNSILYTNELLVKIGYISNSSCSFCHRTIKTKIDLINNYILVLGIRTCGRVAVKKLSLLGTTTTTTTTTTTLLFSFFGNTSKEF